MAYIGEIVDFNDSDGLTPQQVRKLNFNFHSLLDRLVPSSVDQSATYTNQTSRDITKKLNDETEARQQADVNLSNKIIELRSEMTKLVLDTTHPIGSTYITFGAENPATIFTGTTWELIEEGRFLRSTKVDSNSGQTGGADSQSITLAAANMPSHSHMFFDNSGKPTGIDNVYRRANAESNPQAADGNVAAPVSGIGVGFGGRVMVQGGTTGTTSAGSGQAFTVNTVPKFIYVKVWKRVS